MNFFRYVCSRTHYAHADQRQDEDRLLDFDYSNEDIDSLRQQMKLPVSMVSISGTSHSIRTSFVLIRPMTFSSIFSTILSTRATTVPNLFLTQ